MTTAASPALRRAVETLHASLDTGLVAVIEAAHGTCARSDQTPSGLNVHVLEEQLAAAKGTIQTQDEEVRRLKSDLQERETRIGAADIAVQTLNVAIHKSTFDAQVAKSETQVARAEMQIAQSEVANLKSELLNIKGQKEEAVAQLRLEKESSGFAAVERALLNTRAELDEERKQKEDERKNVATERARQAIERDVAVNAARDEQIKKAGLLEQQIASLQSEIGSLQKEMGRARVPTFVGATGEDEIETYLCGVFGQLFVITNVGKSPHCADIRLVARNGCIILIDIKNYGRVAPDSEIKKLHSDVDRAADAGTPVHGAIMFQKMGLRYKDGDLKREKRGLTLVFEIGSWLLDRLVEAIHDVYATYSLSLLQISTPTSKSEGIGGNELTKLRDCISSLVNLAGRQASFSVVNFDAANDNRQDTMANCVEAHAKLAAAHSACEAGVSKQTLKTFEAAMPKHGMGRTRNPRKVVVPAAKTKRSLSASDGNKVKPNATKRKRVETKTPREESKERKEEGKKGTTESKTSPIKVKSESKESTVPVKELFILQNLQ
jgi:hypothetical protein